jgi:chloramphenicol-sensitive protein RarD
MKLLSHIPAAEVVAHRVIWSVPLAAALLIWLGRTGDLMVALRSPRMLGMACVTAALVSLNWGIYVWAITTGHALEAALGYYMNPIFSVALAALLLGERLSRAQFLAIVLAFVAVCVLVMGVLCACQEVPADWAQSGVFIGSVDLAAAGLDLCRVFGEC